MYQYTVISEPSTGKWYPLWRTRDWEEWKHCHETVDNQIVDVSFPSQSEAIAFNYAQGYRTSYTSYPSVEPYIVPLLYGKEQDGTRMAAHTVFNALCNDETVACIEEYARMAFDLWQQQEYAYGKRYESELLAVFYHVLSLLYSEK